MRTSNRNVSVSFSVEGVLGEQNAKVTMTGFSQELNRYIPLKCKWSRKVDNLEYPIANQLNHIYNFSPFDVGCCVKVAVSTEEGEDLETKQFPKVSLSKSACWELGGVLMKGVNIFKVKLSELFLDSTPVQVPSLGFECQLLLSREEATLRSSTELMGQKEITVPLFKTGAYHQGNNASDPTGLFLCVSVPGLGLLETNVKFESRRARDLYVMAVKAGAYLSTMCVQVMFTEIPTLTFKYWRPNKWSQYTDYEHLRFVLTESQVKSKAALQSLVELNKRLRYEGKEYEKGIKGLERDLTNLIEGLKQFFLMIGVEQEIDYDKIEKYLSATLEQSKHYFDELRNDVENHMPELWANKAKTDRRKIKKQIFGEKIPGKQDSKKRESDILQKMEEEEWMIDRSQPETVCMESMDDDSPPVTMTLYQAVPLNPILSSSFVSREDKLKEIDEEQETGALPMPPITSNLLALFKQSMALKNEAFLDQIKLNSLSLMKARAEKIAKERSFSIFKSEEKSQSPLELNQLLGSLKFQIGKYSLGLSELHSFGQNQFEHEESDDLYNFLKLKLLIKRNLRKLRLDSWQSGTSHFAEKGETISEVSVTSVESKHHGSVSHGKAALEHELALLKESILKQQSETDLEKEKNKELNLKISQAKSDLLPFKEKAERMKELQIESDRLIGELEKLDL